MPTLPLYQPDPPSPDDPHDVIAPGGYECWRFDAEDPASKLRVVASLWDGDPRAGRRYALYRLLPTRVRPPLARDSRFACLSVYESERLLGRFRVHTPAPQTQLRSGQLRFGANHFIRDASGPGGDADGDAGGSMHVLMRGTALRGTALRDRPIGHRLIDGQTLTADLIFHPAAAASEQSPAPQLQPQQFTVIPRAWTGCDHRWLVGAAPWRVEGAVHLLAAGAGANGGAGAASGAGAGDGAGAGAAGAGGAGAARIFNFSGRGRGFYDHEYGSGPIGLGVRRRLRGRVICGDRVIAFSRVEPRGADDQPESMIIETHVGGVRAMQETIRPGRDINAGRGLCYPSELTIGSIRLANPRVVSAGAEMGAGAGIRAGGGGFTIIYDAAWEGGSGEAWCEIARFAHPLWPGIRRLSS
jgi:hypothetical protein